jgi:hypothetical protein
MLQNAVQSEMFEIEDASAPARNAKKTSRSGAFTDNMKLPVHGWFRYSAGFSGEWAEEVISSRRFAPGQVVLDPFVGSATSLIAAQRKHVSSAGLENHSFIYRVAQAKLLWTLDEQLLIEGARKLLRHADSLRATMALPDSTLLVRCYTPETLIKLEALKQAFFELDTNDENLKLLWLAITSILRECSGVGTAQWQYLLPNKTKSRVADPFAAFFAKVRAFAADMAVMKLHAGSTPAAAEIINGDARDLASASHLLGRAQLILTSPPYPNNYDYADATRLEMTFWGEIKRWSDLQDSVRFRLIRSCSQHSAAERLDLRDLLADPAVTPIRDELTSVCKALDAAREERAGKKTYHTMIAAYFVDLAKVWKSLRGLCADGGEACFVIGDSAPYGVYVPVDRWLGELALAAGFKSHSFQKLRDRNMKWKNRKHRVPLKEGTLWVKA